MEPPTEVVASHDALLLAMGACATAGLLHLWFWMRGRERTAHLWVAAWCGLSVLFQAARAAQIHAGAPAEALAAARLQTAVAPLLVLAIVGFAHALRGARPRPLPVALLLAGNAALVALALGSDALLTGETYRRLDWFGRPYHATPGAPALAIVALYGLGAFAYAGRAIRRSPALDGAERRVLLGSLGIYLATGVLSVASTLTWVSVPMLTQYSPVLVAVGFTYLLVHRHDRLQGDLQALVDARTAEIAAANARLAESERRYRRLVEDAPLGVLACDREGSILAVNSYLVRLLGSPFAEATERINLLTFPPLVEAGVAELVRRTLDTGASCAAETRYRGHGGREIEIRMHMAALRDAQGRVTGAQGIVEDRGERRRLEERLRRSQRLEAVGQLAAGLAHEINNPMAYVRSNLALLRTDWESLRKAVFETSLPAELQQRMAECEELIDDSLEGVDRTVRIVRDVKEFSRDEPESRESVDPNGVVEDSLRIALPQCEAGVRVEQDYGEVPPVLGSPSQLRQVFVNLLVNAFQAVAKRPGAGRVGVRTRAEPGRVVVRLEDDGCGISEEAQARLFDPFFTTKPAGEGTGLGLYISYEIVQMHGGEIAVESRPGEGTRFEVRLPAADDEAERRTKRGARGSSPARARGATPESLP